MDQPTQEFILDIINRGKDLTLATVREDGYPQATTVSYANDGMTIYIGTGQDSQKVHNIRHCNKVSLTINADYQDWNHIKGVSMGGLAEILADSDEIEHASRCMLQRFPQIKDWAQQDELGKIAFLKIQPQVISVLNYEKGFGHTDLVKA
jgi:general stress protein 26